MDLIIESQSPVKESSLEGNNITNLEVRQPNLEGVDESGDKNFAMKIRSSPACSALISNLFDENDDLQTVELGEKQITSCVEMDDYFEEDSGSSDDISEGRNTTESSVADNEVSFVFRDFDYLSVELSEIYGYYEMSSFTLKESAFQSYVGRKNLCSWGNLTYVQKLDLIQAMVEDCETVNDKRQWDAVLALNYLMQGCWKEFKTLDEQIDCIRENVRLLLRCNAFWTAWMVFKYVNSAFFDLWNRGQKEQVLEGCLNIMCTIMKVAIDEIDANAEVFQDFIEDLKTEDSIFVQLLRFIVTVTEYNTSSFHSKKIFIILNCYLLLTLGDSKALMANKQAHREAAGLRPSKEDTLLTSSTVGILQDNRWWKDGAQRKLMTLMELQELANAEDKSTGGTVKQAFPWSPKSSLKSLSKIHSLIADHSHRTHKFQRYLELPTTIKQKIELLTQHIHIPLGDLQKEQERLISKYPALYKNQEKVFSEETDKIFAAILPMMDGVLNALRSALIECIPRKTLQPTTEYFIPLDADLTYYDEDRFRQSEIVVKAIASILILLLKHFKVNHIYQFECLVSEMVSVSFIATILKFFNRDITQYVYQKPMYDDPECPFKVMWVEYTPCPGDEDYDEYVANKTKANPVLQRRNVMAYTNLLRVLNKLVKGSQCGVRALNMLSPMEAFKRALNVRDPVFQQYLLKLCKLLCRFMSQDWKKSNLQIITGIYYKVRHRILDGGWIGDISVGCKGRKSRLDQSTKCWPWDFSREDLRTGKDVLSYVKRRFGDVLECKCGNKRMDKSPADIKMIAEPTEREFQHWVNAESSQLVEWDRLISDPFVV